MLLSSERTHKYLAFIKSGESYKQFTKMLVILFPRLQNTPVKIHAMWILFKAKQELRICQQLVDRIHVTMHTSRVVGEQ